MNYMSVVWLFTFGPSVCGQIMNQMFYTTAPYLHAESETTASRQRLENVNLYLKYISLPVPHNSSSVFLLFFVHHAEMISGVDLVYLCTTKKVCSFPENEQSPPPPFFGPPSRVVPIL